LGFHPKGMREMISKLLRMRGLVLGGEWKTLLPGW
jgi:hypothetical protein